MAFIDRFIEVPIRLFSKKLEDVGVDDKGEPNTMWLNPFQICRFYPNSEDGENIVTVVFKDGDTTSVYLPIDKFIELLNNHHNQ